MTIMKKILSFITVALVVAACATKEAPTSLDDVVDLRYRVNDVYDLPATNAPVFTIVVKSTKPWTLRSLHPTWCMIETEEGEAVSDSLVRIGKGENTSVKVKYYDNTKLDDRTDTILIASGKWIGKKVIINQKGIAFLDVDEAERALDMAKDGSDVSFHIKSNQNWSVAPDKDSPWLTVKEGATGTLDGIVTVGAPDNSGEMRYGRLDIFDRNGVKMKWQVVITQDGVQLEPVAVEVYNEDTKKNDLELREDYIAHTFAMPVKSNASWTVVKKSEADTWFTLLDAGGTNDGSVRIQFTQNDSDAIREGFIVLTTIPSEPGAAVVTKEVKVRQAYKTVPQRYYLNNEEVFASWKSSIHGDWINAPETVENGMLLIPGTQVKKEKQASSGVWTFHWRDIGANANVRMWWYFGDPNIKFNLKRGNTEISGASGVPSVSYDTSTPHDVTIETVQADGGYCTMTFKLDGTVIGSFTSSAASFPELTWGAVITQLYIGSEAGGDNATFEWYEYSAPFSWE